MERLGINLGYLLVQVFNFLLVLVVLRAWVYRPVLDMLKRRRETLAQQLEDARVAEEARQNAEQEADNILAEARRDANQLLREARERADQAARDIREEAERAAARIRETAKEEAEQTKRQALSEMRGEIASLAIAAAQKVIGVSLDEQRQHALIEEFFSGVKEGKVVLLEDRTLRGTSAEVTSAVQLTTDEQETIKRDILDKLGSSATVSFRVDENILGGLVIRVGDKVLDGSVAGKLENLGQSLQ